MGKPEDIPQGVWDKAESHRQLWARGPGSVKEAVARAILAAKAEERAAILQFEFDLPIRMYGADMMIDIREYIRKRGEPTQ